jgi:preprotein translocase subunit SecE
MKSLMTEDAPKLGLLKWTIIALLFIAGIIANSYLAHIATGIRAIGWIVLVGICAAIASMTEQGRALIAFAQDARIEMRKVVWPTRQETIQTTFVVLALVILMAIILWLIDTPLMWAIGWMTGQRG